MDYGDRVGHAASGDTLAVGAYLKDIGGDQSDTDMQDSGVMYLY